MTRHAHGYRIRAETPWVTKLSVQHDGVDLEPTQQVAYSCDRGPGCSQGGTFAVTLAANADPVPDAVDCRCGGTGRLDGAPADAMPETPGYSQGVKVGKGTGHYKDMRPVALMMERRMRAGGGGKALLEENLAWALARVRGQAS